MAKEYPMFPPSVGRDGMRGWWVRPSQEERRVVSTETEVGIPNREALSIWVFLGIAFTGLIWWARWWRVDAIAVLFGLAGVIYWARYGADLEDELSRPGFIPVTPLDWIAAVIATIFWVFCVQLLPYFISGAVWGISAYWVLTFWLAEFPKWWGASLDVCMGFSLSFLVAAGTVSFFHFMNVTNPAWPPPYRAIAPGEEQPPEQQQRVVTRPVFVNRNGNGDVVPAAEPAFKTREFTHTVDGPDGTEVDARDMKVFVKLLPVRGTAQSEWLKNDGTSMPSGRTITQPAHMQEFMSVLEYWEIVYPIKQRHPVKFRDEFIDDGQPDTAKILAHMGLIRGI